MENEEKKKQSSLIITGILCAALLGISIAYAALTAALDITMGKVTQNALSWNVGFETGTVNATKVGSGTCGAATVTADTVSVANTTLTTLHDKCTYPLTIKNTGSVGATLATIAPKTPTGVSCTNSGASMVCGNITYKLATDAAGSTLLTNNRDLAATTGTLNVYFVAEYTGTNTGSSATEYNNAGFTLTYNQK